MKYLILLALFSFSALAKDFSPRHMISFGNGGLGGSASKERFSTSNSSFLKDFDITKGNLALNYAYRISSRWQIGGFISNFSENRSFKTTSGKKGVVNTSQVHYGITGIYNFDDDLFNSWYSALTLSIYNHEEEFTHNTPYSALENDRGSEILELTFGKRFDLKKYNIQNIVYSPDLTIFVANNHKDFQDDGIDHSTGIILRFIKFDVLF